MEHVHLHNPKNIFLKRKKENIWEGKTDEKREWKYEEQICWMDLDSVFQLGAPNSEFIFNHKGN